MEEKLSILEAVGVVKGFIFKNYNEDPKQNSNSSTTCKPKDVIKKDKHGKKSLTNTAKQIIDFNIEVIEKLNKTKYNTINIPEKNLIQKENFSSNDSASKMEDNKTTTVFSDESNFFSNSKLITSVHDVTLGKEKTDECDSFDFSKTLASLSESKILGNNMIELSEENNSSEGEYHNGENIPKENNTHSTVQEWINQLKSKDLNLKNNPDYLDLQKEELQSPSFDETNAVTAKLSREASVQSNSSLDSILDSRRPDPVEIFLNLGFGGVPGVNMENCRIPKRFLVPSKCKGGDWNEFLRRELIQAQNFECSSLGFRGLSGPSYRRPSAIVANIMEKLRESTVGTPPSRCRFSSVAKRIINEKSVLNKLSSESSSVLSPDNRKFLQNQGKISPEVPRRRIIFGQKSFAFAHDGEFIEVENKNASYESSKDGAPSLSTKSDDEDSVGLPNPEVLLKLRRSSLQKQKNVEEDTDVEDVFYLPGKVDSSEESDLSFKTNHKCSKKTGKIPKRFFSSSNLKTLEVENDKSDTMRLEVEKEILALSQKVKNINNHDLASVLEQVKQLRSKLETAEQDLPDL